MHPSEKKFLALLDLYRKGEFQRAREWGEALISEFPNLPPAFNILGAIYIGLGQPEKAISSWTKVIDLMPEHAGAHHNIGTALNELGRQKQAVASFRKAIQFKPDYAEAHFNLASILHVLDQPEEAIASYVKATQLRPDYAEAHSNLGTVLNDQDRVEEAIASATKVVRCRPDFPEGYSNLADFLRRLDRNGEAIANYTKAIQLKPDYAEAHNKLGTALSDLGRLEEAIVSYTKAIEIKIEYAEAYNNLGIAQSQLGRKEAATASYAKALEIKPDYSEVYRNLSIIKQFETAADQQIEKMTGLLESESCSDQDSMRLNFALGKANADLGEYEAAFTYLSEGNRLRKAELGYDRNASEAMFAQTKAWFSGEAISLDAAPSSLEQTPIFIVGMPRSGTTLVEQILASHSQVHGAGELMLLGNSIHPTGSAPQSLNSRWLQATREAYLSGLVRLDTTAPFITDKMTSNFLYIGFILCALPEGKIIHLKRDARATCWSIFKHYFTVKGNSYAYSLEDITHFYKLYVDLMAFWHERFPGRIQDFNYEALTENQEQETRHLLQLAGLDWDDNCLSFYDTKRPVATASLQQIRQKMYTGSSEDWHKYEQFLLPMLDALVEF